MHAVIRFFFIRSFINSIVYVTFFFFSYSAAGSYHHEYCQKFYMRLKRRIFKYAVIRLNDTALLLLPTDYWFIKVYSTTRKLAK